MHAFEVALVVFWAITLVGTAANVLSMPRLRATDRRRGPFVSVIVPARNEERGIEACIRALLAQTYDDLEVIVVNDRSTDRTGEILAAIRSPRLRVLTGQETPEDWLGKPWALEQGSGIARGTMLLFVDADVLYQPAAVAAMVEALENAKGDMLAVLPHFEMRGVAETAAMSGILSPLMSFLSPWIVNRTRTPAFAVGAGVGNLVRRDAYEVAGGHGALKDAAIDDVALSRQLRLSGRRTLIFVANDLVSVRMYHGAAEVVNGFSKNVFTAIGRSWVAAGAMLVALVATRLVPLILLLLGHRLAAIAYAELIAARMILYAALRYPIAAALLLDPATTVIWIWILIRSAKVTGSGELEWRGRRARRWTRFGR